MKQVILGTAGHIDHGKTALVKALTGIDCDRLKEEKERGITIDIGFAHLLLPDGVQLGIVDVPGHERFVRNMLSGAHGIDLVMLVIAADEGVMPQTREHLDIVTLLGVKKGLTVLTKADLVDDEWLALVKEEVGEFLRGSFLAGSPILPVSSITGEGIEKLVASLEEMVASVEERQSEGLFRLPIDRVFTMKGFGTVVTGTLTSGRVEVGETVEILPAGHEAKVRGLQVHGRHVAEATAGLRTAVNLQGVERETITRGDMLARRGYFRPTRSVEVFLRQLKGAPRPLKRRAQVRFHAGTAEVMARVVRLAGLPDTPFDRGELEPGEEGCAFLLLDAPVVVARGDRFVLRSYSPVVTIGGGEVLDPQPSRWRRPYEKLSAELELLRDGSDAQVVELFVQRSGTGGASRKVLAGRAGLSERVLASVLDLLEARGCVTSPDRDAGRLVHNRVLNDLKETVLEVMKEYRRRNPLKEGISKEELRSKLPGADQRLVAGILEDLTGAGILEVARESVRLRGHGVSMGREEEELAARLEVIFKEAGFTPPLPGELAEKLGAPVETVVDLLNILVSQGVLTRVKEGFYFHRPAMEDLRGRLVSFLTKHGEISPAQYKELTGASRKFTVPLMEYFDSDRLTIRVGDLRRLRANVS